MTRTILLAVLVLGISLCADEVALGQTYYLDPVHGNNDNDGSAGSPWRTIEHAGANAANGATIYLRSGNYGAVSLNGVPSARTSWDDALLFTPDVGHTPVLACLQIADMEQCYMQFDGFRVQCQTSGWDAYGCRVLDASHVKITNLDILGLWHSTDKDKITPYGVMVNGQNADVSDVLVEGCTIQQVTYVAQAQGRIRSGLVFRRNTGTKINASLLRFMTDQQNDTILVEYNNVSEHMGIGDPHGSGLSIRNGNMAIRGNIIRDYGGSGGIRFYENGEKNGALPADGYSNILCEGNLIYGSKVSTGVFARHIGHNFIFRNNTFVSKWRDSVPSGRWRYYGSATFGLDPSGTGENVKIHNNIFLGLLNIHQSLIDAGVQADHNLIWAFTTGNLEFQPQPLGANSILVCSGNSVAAPFSNTYFETPGTFFLGTSSFTEAFDPTVRTPNIDAAFRLDPGAIAINAGSALHASPYCIEGLPRTGSDDTQPDLEAYEYRAGTPTNREPILNVAGNHTTLVNEQPSFVVTADDADLGDVSDPDDDNDGLTDEEELAGWDITIYDCTGNRIDSTHVTSDPFDLDTDSDGLGDLEEKEGWDVRYRLENPDSPPRWIWIEYHVASNPREADADSDGLNDWQEKVHKTDPARANTDCDGAWDTNDGFEIDYRLNPLDFDTDDDGLSDGSEIDLWIMVAGHDPEHPGLVPSDVLFEAVAQTDDPVIPAFIDIKPGSYPNVINLGSQDVIPVAILSSVDFDATAIDPATVGLSGAGVAVRGKGKSLAHSEDVNDDGLPDLVCQVEAENLDPGAFQDGYAILTGKTSAGVPIEGRDEIAIVPGRK